METPFGHARIIFGRVKGFSLHGSTLALLILVAVFAIAKFSNPQGAIFSILAYSAFSVGADALMCLVLNKKAKISLNSAITGLILGSILPIGDLWQVFTICAFAILSKHMISHAGAPIFNPAAFAIVLAGLVFGIYSEWWASSDRIVLLLLALFLAWKLGKFQMQIAFAGAWIVSNCAKIFISGGSNYASSLLVPAYFMAFMLLEPKTSPAKPSRQIAYGVIVAVLAVALQYTHSPMDNLALALIIANIVKKAMDYAKIL